jgi:transposase-like protein
MGTNKLGLGAEEIIRKLRQADVLLSQGKTVLEISRELGVSDSTYYKWRKDYGGVSIDQVRRLKELERENERLKKAVAELTIDKVILKEAARGNF